MAKNLDDFVKITLNERYEAVLQALREHRDAIEQMTKELLDIEVISGERVREIIKENGGVVFEDEDLHSEALNDEKDEEKVDESSKEETPNENSDKDEDSKKSLNEEVEENKDNKKE